jgi:adenylate cyclase, class 2
LLEVEAKYRLPDRDRLEAKLAELNAIDHGGRTDVDTYLNAPDRDFAKTDEALRLRRIGEKLLLTYKGPRKDSATKTRREIETPVGQGDAQAATLLQLFESLGYRKVAEVVKRRHHYELPYRQFALHVCIDVVEQVGTFVELEIAAEEGDYAEAKEALFATALELGLNDIEQRSYLEQRLGHTVPPGGQQDTKRETTSC